MNKKIKVPLCNQFPKLIEVEPMTINQKAVIILGALKENCPNLYDRIIKSK